MGHERNALGVLSAAPSPFVTRNWPSGPCTVAASHRPTKSLLPGYDGQTNAPGPLWEGEARAKPLKFTIGK